MTTQRQRSWWNPTVGWSGSKERLEFQEYQQAGGGLGFNAWLRQGKTRPPTKLSAYGAGILPPRAGAMVAEATPADIFAQREREKRLKAEADTKPPTPPRPSTTLEEAEKRLKYFEEKYGAGSYYLEYDDESGQYTVKRDPSYFTEKREEARGRREPFGFNPYDNPQTPEVEGGWTGTEWAPPYGWISPSQQGEMDLRERQMEQSRLENEAMMDWYREQAQMQQQEQERQYRSQLMANPMSWLQYSSYTGQTPVVQEWMKPLMSGQYQTGQQLPGWMGGQQTEGQAMGSLPELRTPSAQLWGRMGPTAQGQWMGYQQARTGIRPEESAFRLRATAPPSGNFGGLRRMR